LKKFDLKKNPKILYACIRSKTKVEDAVGPLLNSDGYYVSDNDATCNILNEYFRSVFTEQNDVSQLPGVVHRFSEDSNDMLQRRNLTEDAIMNRLKKRKVNMTSGMDNIVPRLLVENAKCRSKPLLLIFFEWVGMGIAPKQWKCASVTAIFKKGFKDYSCNYRPVSLTSHVCKVLESMSRDEMLAHLKKYNLTEESQRGFVQKRSCLTSLLEFLEPVTNYVNQGYPIVLDVIYLVFQNAFDKFPHKRLMLKLRA
jgi:Reverse transcriptase (RNA-dependent DNA polymerase)